jgi:hypothetical protein
VFSFFIAGAIGGVIVGHIALASIARNGGEGRKPVLAIVVVSWVLLAAAIALFIPPLFTPTGS